MAILKRSAVVVCCLLCVFVGVENSLTEKCQSQQRTTKHIELCHDNLRPQNDGPFECYQPNYGFVLTSFKIAPRSEFDDCGSFVVNNYLDAKCLRNEVDKVDQFDASVFDLLEKVSGKNKIDNNTVVDRFSWSITPEKEGGTQDSSAFLSFQNLCKPAVRSSDKADNQVVRMCSTDKAANSIAALTLQGMDTGQVSDGLSRCRCTLSPPHSVTIKVLDIRLQHRDNKACSPDVSLKMYSGNQTFQDLRCEGLSAHYGLEEMLTTDREVTLELTVSNRGYPTAVWLQVLSMKDSSSSLENVIISCDGITQLGKVPTTPANEDGDKGTDIGKTVGLVIGVLFSVIFIAAIIIFIFIRKSRRRQQNLKAAEDNDSEVSRDYATIDECHDDLKVKPPSVSEQKAPTPPPNHPRRQSEVECGRTEEDRRLSEKDGKLPEVECRPATEEDRRQSEKVRKVSEANPVSKPPRSYSYSQDSSKDKEVAPRNFSYSQDSAKDKEVAPRSFSFSQDSAKDKEVAPRNFSYSQDSAKDKEVAVADQPSEEYDHLMHQGSTGRKEDARGDSQKSISDRKKNSYHHLDLGNNSAETKPLHPQTDK